MNQHAARCPFCVTVVRLEPSFWERLGIHSAKQLCPACRRTFDSRDAHTMGAAYGNWVDHFTHELASHVRELPMLAEQALQRALGSPPKEETRLIPTLEELIRSCAHHHRAVLVEKARGRDASLEVAHLPGPDGNHETLAILGTSSSESGAKEWQQIIARSGLNHFVLYTYPSANGAEPRVKRAVHEKARNHEHNGATAASLAAHVPPHVQQHVSAAYAAAHPPAKHH